MPQRDGRSERVLLHSAILLDRTAIKSAAIEHESNGAPGILITRALSCGKGFCLSTRAVPALVASRSLLQLESSSSRPEYRREEGCSRCWSSTRTDRERPGPARLAELERGYATSIGRTCWSS